MESDNPTTQSKADVILASECDIAESLAVEGGVACDEWAKVLDILERAESPDDPALIVAALLGIGAELRELNEKVDDLDERGITVYHR